MWSTLCSWPEVAGTGQQPESVSLSDGVLKGLGLHAESAPCCRLLPTLFLAPTTPTPQLPWVERDGGKGWVGGWGWGGLSRRGELKVNVCRHNGEGLLPHGGRAHFKAARLPVVSSPHLCSPLPLQRSAASAPACCSIFRKKISLIESRSLGGALKCVLFKDPQKQLDDHEALCGGEIV